jgi:hypothetical protein
MNLSKANVGTPLTVRSEDNDGDKINTSLKMESDSFDGEALLQNSFCSSYIGSIKSLRSQTVTETQRNEGTRKLFIEGNDRIVPIQWIVLVTFLPQLLLPLNLIMLGKKNISNFIIHVIQLLTLNRYLQSNNLQALTIE